MIKGVNKQIVEINYTQNDYIEKAILIINPEKSKLSKDLIKQKADAYMKTLLPEQSADKLEKRRKHLSVFGQDTVFSDRKSNIALTVTVIGLLVMAAGLLLAFAFLF